MAVLITALAAQVHAAAWALDPLGAEESMRSRKPAALVLPPQPDSKL